MSHRSDDAEPTRLNHWFTEQGLCSRREADRWIEAGRVTINGVVAPLGAKVALNDRVAVDGKTIARTARHPIVIAFNKPVGIECTADPRVPNNLIDAVAYPERLVHIGRLDVMSEGLILLTNRGELVNGILRREFAHEKEYIVELSHPISDEEIARLSRGVDIGDERGKTRPCTIDRLGEARLRIILTEGRNRQIRKMIEVVGNHVRRLERIRIMHIRLGSLPRGTWRHLSSEDLRELFFALKLERPKGSLRPPSHRPPKPTPSNRPNAARPARAPHDRPARPAHDAPARQARAPHDRPARPAHDAPSNRPSRALGSKPPRR